MGYAKLNEDIADRYYENYYLNQYYKENYSFNKTVLTNENDKGSVKRKCYYCDHLFNNLLEMNDHIKEKHSIPGPLLLLNEKIIQNNETFQEVYVATIKSAKIIMCGYNKNIKIDGRYIHNESDLIDLNPIIYFENFNSLKIEIGERIIIIKKYEEKNIKNEDVDVILNNWEMQLEKKIRLSPDPSQYPKKLNEVEKRYLNGFYNYYLACLKDISPTDKRNRYYESYSILSSFLSLRPKGRIVLKIIAFKNNWIDKLDNLCTITSGTFNEVVDFYKNRNSKNETNINSQVEEKIFTEPGIQECINAIIAVQQGDEESCLEYLNFWTDKRIKESQLESNEVDRILYLKSIFHIKNRKIFKNYIKEIKTPFFKNNLNSLGNEK